MVAEERTRTSHLRVMGPARCQLRHPATGEIDHQRNRQLVRRSDALSQPCQRSAVLLKVLHSPENYSAGVKST